MVMNKACLFSLMCAPLLLACAPIKEVNAIGDPLNPTIGDLQNAINEAGMNFTKVTTIDSYDGESRFPFQEKNPATQLYTEDGLYQVERNSGYYNGPNAIWHCSKGEGETWNYALSESTYQHYYHRYTTFACFSGTFCSTYLSATAKEGSDGLSYVNDPSKDISQAQLIQLVYMLAPLVTIDEGQTISNYSLVFTMDAGLHMSSISIECTISQLEGVEKSGLLRSEAIFSDIGTTVLPYVIAEDGSVSNA